MPTKVEDLEGQLSAVLTEAKTLAETAKSRDESGDFNAAETETATRIKSDVSRLKGELDAARKSAGLRAEIDAIGELIGTKTDEDGEPIITEDDVREFARSKKMPRGAGKRWSEQVIESDWFKGLQASHPGSGDDRFSKMRIESPPISLKAIFTEGGATQGGPLIAPMERGLTDTGPFMRPMVLRDLITVGRTSQEAVRYARITGFTNAADGVHEASTPTGTNAAGGLKPQSDLQVEAKTSHVVTIAHWFAASKQALADIPALQTLIDQFGRYGLEEEEEDQIIDGAGSASDELEGFSNDTGIATQTFSTNMFNSIRKGITKVRKEGRARPNGVLLNLEDDEFMDLYRTDGGGGAGTGPWAGNGPWQMGPPSIWGLPRVTSEAVPSGKAYVADFRTVVLLVREDPNFRMTDSHADYFVRNLVALLFEERAVQLIVRPKAICEVATA